MKKIKMPELLAPASGWQLLRAAVMSGADAVYFGAGSVNMRAHAKNFTPRELPGVVNYCHENNVKAYLTVNTIVYDNEIGKLEKLLVKAKIAKIDAVILWDMAILGIAKKLGLNMHLSTQASVANTKAAEFYKKQGVSRVILARECSLKKIREIANSSKLEIETFIHGAMCVSISGRCFLSQEVFKRSANRGDCIQPCRREYLIKDMIAGSDLVLGENYIMSPKDLCGLPFIDRLIKAGVSCFKIEGRNRSPEYVKTVTKAYRKAIDDCFDRKLKKKDREENTKRYMEELGTVYNRGFSSGFYIDTPTNDDFTDCDGSKATTRKSYLGVVENYYKKAGAADIRLYADNVRVGDDLLIIGNKTGIVDEKVSSIHQDDKEVKKAHKGCVVGISTKNRVRRNDKVYIVKKV